MVFFLYIDGNGKGFDISEYHKTNKVWRYSMFLDIPQPSWSLTVGHDPIVSCSEGSRDP